MNNSEVYFKMRAMICLCIKNALFENICFFRVLYIREVKSAILIIYFQANIFVWTRKKPTKEILRQKKSIFNLLLLFAICVIVFSFFISTVLSCVHLYLVSITPTVMCLYCSIYCIVYCIHMDWVVINVREYKI